MTFVKTIWVDDDVPDIDAGQLNRIEQGVADAHAMAGMQFIGDMVAGGQGAGAGQLGINNIPQGFRHLRVISRGQSTNGATDNLGLRINGIATSYFWTYKGLNQGGNFDGVSPGQTYAYVGPIPGTNRANDNYFGHHVIDIPFYSAADGIKTFHSSASMHNGAADFYGVQAISQCIATANPVTSLMLLGINGTLSAKARASVYGIL